MRLSAIVCPVLVSLWSTALASTPSPPANPNAHDLASFFDRYLGAHMAANHVVGAAVAVVEGDRVLLAKGYGQADLSRGTPVDAEKTTFLIGSLSKIFTWTAVMQLAERGKVDLDADVNRYLDFRIPDTFPEPVTLRHLMDHTSGFENRKFGQLSAGPGPAAPLRAWLAGHVPARIFRPGLFSAYGNYNAALAGYVVQRVSGMPFDVSRTGFGSSPPTARQSSATPGRTSSATPSCFSSRPGTWVSSSSPTAKEETPSSAPTTSPSCVPSSTTFFPRRRRTSPWRTRRPNGRGGSAAAIISPWVAASPAPRRSSA